MRRNPLIRAMPSLPADAAEYSAISSIGRAALLSAARPIVVLAIDALQLALALRNRGLGILGAGAVVGEHVDHQEVGDRGRRLFAGRADAGSRKRALRGLSENGVLRVRGPHRRRVVGVERMGEIAPCAGQPLLKI